MKAVRQVTRNGMGSRWFVASGRAFSSTHTPKSSAAMFAGVGSALGAGFLWAATVKPALAEEESKKGSKVGGVCSNCPQNSAKKFLHCLDCQQCIHIHARKGTLTHQLRQVHPLTHIHSLQTQKQTHTHAHTHTHTHTHTHKYTHAQKRIALSKR